MSAELVPLSWCLHPLSAPCQLGSSWTAHCSISLCREISWEEKQGELDRWGNQLGESRRGTGSGQQPRHSSKHRQQPHGSSTQSPASGVPPLPAPTSTAMQDREGLCPPTATPQREKHKSHCWESILTLVSSGHGCGWAHPHDSCSSCSLLLLHRNNLCQNVWLVSSVPGACLRLTPGSKDSWTFKGTKRAEWL